MYFPLKKIAEKRILQPVALIENLISTSSVGKLFFLQHFLILDSKVKHVNVGKSNREGWVRKVLTRPSCHKKYVPVSKPGRVYAKPLLMGSSSLNDAELNIIGTERNGGRWNTPAFCASDQRQVGKMTMNPGEKNPP